MTSTRDLPKQGEPEGWSPSNIHYLVPTLIIPCGNLARFADFREALDRRLEPYVADGLLHWTTVLNPTDIVEKGYISNQLDPFLKHELWQRLVDKGYVQYLPDADHPIQLQILVICDLLKKTDLDVVSGWLEKLAASVKSRIGNRALYSLILILLGEPGIDAAKVQPFWPRVYLSKEGWGGTKFETGQVLQACQNVVAGFVTSEFSRAIDYVISKDRRSVKWIALGAASIMVDLAIVRKRFHIEVLKEFIEPMIQEPPNEIQRRKLDDAMDAQARKFQAALLRGENEFGVKEIMEAHGWNFNAEGQEIKDCHLTPTSNIARVAFGKKPEWWLGEIEKPPAFHGSLFEKLIDRVKRGFLELIDLLHPIPLPAHEKLAVPLAENYQALDDALQKELSQRTTTEYRRLLDTFAFLLDRNSYAGENRRMPLDPNDDWPAGLQAVRYSIRKFMDVLTHSVGIKYNGHDVEPSPLGTATYWEAAAAEDALVLEGAIRRYERLRRSISSGWGAALKLIVAWPLLYGLLDVLTHWDQWVIILVPAAALVLLGLIELIVWQVRARQLLAGIRREINSRLTKRVLSVVAKTLYDYRLLVLAHLRPIRRAFGNIDAVIREEYQRVQSGCDDAGDAASSREDGTQYWLLDFKRALGTETVMVKADRAEEEGKRAEEWEPLEGESASIWRDPESGREIPSWKSEARRKANVEAMRENENYRKAETAIIAKHLLPLFQHPASPLEVVKAFRELGTKWALQEFKPQLMETYLLVDETETLKDGVKWRWLFQHAHPMGASSELKGRLPFTLVVVPDNQSLGGPTGKISTYWRPDWLVICSRQANEIGCIRGIVKKKADQKE
ncbi:MAG: hypothetical protein ABIJ39_08420 [Chloroflexota bacterium]